MPTQVAFPRRTLKERDIQGDRPERIRRGEKRRRVNDERRSKMRFERRAEGP